VDPMRLCPTVTALSFAVLCQGEVAAAAEITDVASSFDTDNAFDFRFRVRFDHTEKRAQIKREFEGLTPTQDRILLGRDLVYERRREAVTLRTELGLWHDLMLFVELPVVVSDLERYRFDQPAGSGCVFAPAADPTCIDAQSSSTVADGIAPAAGFDAERNGVAFSSGNTLFRGVQRGALHGRGLDAFDTLNLGLTWAPISQHRDDTKPTWTLTFEPQISIGTIKSFDRARPDANRGVSDGLHHLFFRTAISKRIRAFDPYIGFWYMLPIARQGSLFKDYGPAQKVKSAQQEAGTTFGVEIIPFERPKHGHKISLDFRGRIEGHFRGRGYSEAWELFASSPALACDPNFNRACDPAVASNAYQNQPFTGITTIDSFATIGADFALAVQLGRHFRLRAGFQYTHDQAHFITGDDVGTPTTASGRVELPNEFNPAYRPVIDQVGRRFQVDNVNVYDAYVWTQLMF
jgi:hypothetical protein